MTCDHFRRIWEVTNRPRAELLLNYETGPSEVRKGRPKFVRMDEWMKRQPSMNSRRPCKCGCSDDAWRCWHDVKQDELLGERRSVR
jgi:hypothetical protein